MITVTCDTCERSTQLVQTRPLGAGANTPDGGWVEREIHQFVFEHVCPRCVRREEQPGPTPGSTAWVEQQRLLNLRLPR